MRKLFVVFGVIAALTLPITSTSAAGSNKTLYSFETGTDGWWTFAHETTLTRTQDTSTGAGGSAASLKVAYQWGAGGGYMGLGIQPKWSMGNEKWTDYAKGHLALSLKSDVTCTVRIELRSADKKTYTATLKDVPTTWKDYAIPFDTFVSDGKSIDLTGADIDQIVIIPGKINNDAHTLWMDNVMISKNPVKS